MMGIENIDTNAAPTVIDSQINVYQQQPSFERRDQWYFKSNNEMDKDMGANVPLTTVSHQDAL